MRNAGPHADIDAYLADVDMAGTTIETFARKIAENGPLAVQKIKETVLKALGRPTDEGYALEDEATRFIIRTEDAREGPRAFAEKRPPRYAGR